MESLVRNFPFPNGQNISKKLRILWWWIMRIHSDEYFLTVSSLFLIKFMDVNIASSDTWRSQVAGRSFWEFNVSSSLEASARWSPFDSFYSVLGCRCSGVVAAFLVCVPEFGELLAGLGWRWRWQLLRRLYRSTTVCDRLLQLIALCHLPPPVWFFPVVLFGCIA